MYKKIMSFIFKHNPVTVPNILCAALILNIANDINLSNKIDSVSNELKKVVSQSQKIEGKLDTKISMNEPSKNKEVKKSEPKKMLLSPELLSFRNNLFKNRTWDNDYNKVVNKDYKIVVWTWKGNATVKEDQFRTTINSVLQRLSFVPQETKNIEHLLYETACAETSRGATSMIQEGGGPARGIFQMEIDTEKNMISWLKTSHKLTYQEVMVFYDKTQNEEWNRTYNIPYQIAMSTAYYWRMGGDKFYTLLDTRDNRAKLWKVVYNTHLGKGTVDGYMENAKKLSEVSNSKKKNT